MIITNSPILLLIIPLVLFFVLYLLIKIIDTLRERVELDSNKSQKESKPKTDNTSKPIEEKSKEQLVNTSNNETEEVYSSSFNYLYDRFVDSPTNEDIVEVKNYSNVFITEEEMQERHKEEKDLLDKTRLYAEIEKMADENKKIKEEYINEFNSLPKEMKLLLINNILGKID